MLVWGTALGLQDELDALLARAVEDVNSGAAPAGSTYLPGWYATSAVAATSGGSGGSGSSSGGLTSPVSGLMSARAIPNFGAMFAVLGTIGDSVVVSSSSGGSRFEQFEQLEQQLRRRQLGWRRRRRRRRFLTEVPAILRRGVGLRACARRSDTIPPRPAAGRVRSAGAVTSA